LFTTSTNLPTSIIEKKGKLTTDWVWSKMFELHDFIHLAYEASVSDLGKKAQLG
jgi:hypothetical protein